MFSRSRGEIDDLPEKNLGLVHILKILSVLVVFVAGVIIGLAMSSSINQYSKEQYFYANHISAIIPSNCSYTPTCENENCMSMESFLRPRGLMHGLSDEELFWRASMVPGFKEYPYDRVSKVAFMFLTRGVLPFIPLWERYFRGQDKKHFTIYVHTLPGFELRVHNSSVFYGRQIPNKKVSWGSPTMTDAEKRLLANALLDFSNERFVLLSESCIPIYDFPTAYNYLIGSSHSFVESYDEPTRYGRGRYSRKMLPYIRLAHWRKGSQWFELNRALASAIISDTFYYNLFRKYCKPSCYPDEHYIPTYLNMFHGSMNANRTVTWVDWSVLGPHPGTYGEANITVSFIQSLRNNRTCTYNSEKTSVCYLFARKFTPDALKPLLNLSLTIMKF